ncbi:hypothetical protein DIPPA_10761 [Diplonema papillatum]|nr:hypothetical protein DIPPA_10761 [Diplonema papillatum]
MCIPGKVQSATGRRADGNELARALKGPLSTGSYERLVKTLEDRLKRGPPCEIRDAGAFFLHTKMPIRDFMARIREYLNCTYETLAVATVYMERWCSAAEVPLTRDVFFKLLFASTLVAIKLREDAFFSNAYYAKIWGFSLDLANELEQQLLSTINWNLHVSPSQCSDLL